MSNEPPSSRGRMATRSVQNVFEAENLRGEYLSKTERDRATVATKRK